LLTLWFGIAIRVDPLPAVRCTYRIIYPIL
jgi:hypothetical protein